MSSIQISTNEGGPESHQSQLGLPKPALQVARFGPPQLTRRGSPPATRSGQEMTPQAAPPRKELSRRSTNSSRLFLTSEYEQFVFLESTLFPEVSPACNFRHMLLSWLSVSKPMCFVSRPSESFRNSGASADGPPHPLEEPRDS